MAGGFEEPLVTKRVSLAEAQAIQKRRLKNGLTGQYHNRRWVDSEGRTVAFSY